MSDEYCKKCDKPTCVGNCKTKKSKDKKLKKKKLKWTPNGVQYED